jgi:hypothetical protein
MLAENAKEVGLHQGVEIDRCPDGLGAAALL